MRDAVSHTTAWSAPRVRTVSHTTVQPARRVRNGMQEGMNYYANNSNDVAESNYYLGIYYYLTNELHKSIQYILDSYGIRKELYGQENPETALSIYFLGKLYEKIGEQNIAIKHQAEACEIFNTYHTMHLKLEIDSLVSSLIH